jgi:hypothetical protein
VLACAIAIVLAAGCGGGDSDSPNGAVEDYFQAVKDRDGETACGLLTENALDSSTLPGAPTNSEDCVEGVNNLPEEELSSIGDVTAETTEESGDTATVEVTVKVGDVESPPISIDMVKEDDQWKLNGLSIADVEI